MTPHTIVFTHGHIDHTAGAAAIIEHYREKGCEITVGIHRKDAEYLKEDAADVNRSFLPPENKEADEVFQDMFGPRPKPDFYFKEGDTLPESDLQVIHIPGHTPGSVCFFSETTNALFTGDSLFFDGLGRTDIQGGDGDKMLKLLEKKVFSLAPQTVIYPGHGPLSTIERETREDSFKTDHGMI